MMSLIEKLVLSVNYRKNDLVFHVEDQKVQLKRRICLKSQQLAKHFLGWLHIMGEVVNS